MGIDCRDGVCIHAQHADAGQQILQLLLDPLRAAADLAQMPAADGTARRHRLAVAADVAHEPPVRMVIRQRQAAARTHRGRCRIRHRPASGSCRGG